MFDFLYFFPLKEVLKSSVLYFVLSTHAHAHTHARTLIAPEQFDAT